jgi:hypothetical protein
VQEPNFPELTTKKAKIDKSSSRTGNSAQQIKSESLVAHIHDILVPKLFRLKQALSFLRGVCILKTSVSTKVNRHTNLHFSLK